MSGFDWKGSHGQELDGAAQLGPMFGAPLLAASWVLWFSSTWLLCEASLGFLTAWSSQRGLTSYMVFNVPQRKWKLLVLRKARPVTTKSLYLMLY